MTIELRSLIADDTGSVGVDWTLIGAAIVGMVLAVVALIGGEMTQSNTQSTRAMSVHAVDDGSYTEAKMAAMVQVAGPNEGGVNQ